MDVLPTDLKRLILEFHDEYAIRRSRVLMQYAQFFNPHVMQLISGHFC